MATTSAAPVHLIVGCGYLGRRVADLWLRQGKPVAALTRNRASELRALGIEPIVGDVLTPPPFSQVDTVLYAVGLDRSAGRSFREVYVDGLRNILGVLPCPQRFIYVSSTSVYGQTDGSWIDESSPIEPSEENGKIVLEAEQLLRTHLPHAIVLRFAGIYGPGRMIRRAAIEKGEPLTGDFDRLINLIHVDDGARAILAAEERGKPGETYLIADGTPATRRDFYTYMAEILGAPAPQFVPAAEPSGRDAANRRIGNRKMIEELHVRLLHPDYRSGLRTLKGQNVEHQDATS
jgi:nucleoside-diphosphate-sugar epimerase